MVDHVSTTEEHGDTNQHRNKKRHDGLLCFFEPPIQRADEMRVPSVTIPEFWPVCHRGTLKRVSADLALVAQSNAELQSLLTQRSYSALHCLGNFDDRRPRIGMFPQLCRVSFGPRLTFSFPCLPSHAVNSPDC